MASQPAFIQALFGFPGELSKLRKYFCNAVLVLENLALSSYTETLVELITAVASDGCGFFIYRWHIAV